MPRRCQRRGVILLLVVSLLALFILLGATFSVVAIQALHGSKLELKVQQHGDLPETEMDLVMGQILYDTQARTALWGQSLLADLYGIDGIAGTVLDDPSIPTDNPNSTNPVPAVAGTTGQILRFMASMGTAAEQPYPPANLPVFSPVPDYYTGRVLTFRSGPLNGVSTRIVRYEPPVSNTATFYVEMPKRDANIAAFPANSDRFVINGAPFNGTGFGYGNNGSGPYSLNEYQSPATPRTTGQEYYALLPHLSAYQMSGLTPIFTAAAGGMDESYDAADYQNVYLAMVPPGVTRNPNLPILPSFHRPELVNYWLNKINTDPLTGQINFTDPNILNFLRQFIFRPMPWDHPNFTGSNPHFPNNTSAIPQLLNSLRGLDASGTTPIRPWDVDNDSDTIPDSIWIDPGLPIITMPDGRRVKRLAAVLIKDLDGRINVNAHGNSQQWFEDTSLLGTNRDVHRTAFPIPQNPPPNDWKAGGTSANPLYLSRGLGMGPTEVDFQHIFGTAVPATSRTAYQNLITARYIRGNENKPGVSGNDYYTAFRWMGLPLFQPTQPSAAVFAKEWASPPDVWGRGAMGLDQFGQPYWLFSGQYYETGSSPVAEYDDNPYEFQYDYARAAADQPYLPREMERLLRFHDADSLSLQSRLIDTTLGFLGSAIAGERPGELGESHYRRELLTTMGSYVPVPPGIHASHLRAGFGIGPIHTGKNLPGAGYNTILDLYARDLANAANFNQAWQMIVPFEFRHGELFNINRPFGNGVDDNNNFIADEPLESVPANPHWIIRPGPTQPGLSMEPTNDSPLGPTANTRQEFARHLYCLMMMMLYDPNTNSLNWQVQRDLDGNGTPNQLDTARLIAQWAVNVVDFRDSDCIMTRFEYDPAPFDSDGWSVTPGSSPVVWGVERPELLITETFAFHDRRTEDLNNESPDPATDMAEYTAGHPSNPMTPDGDYDQRYMPQAACFIELYNPWFDASNGALQRYPRELYTTQAGVTGVNLARISDVGNAPVWRMLVVTGQAHSALLDQNHNPDAARLNDTLIQNPTDVERAIYFTNPAAVLAVDPLPAQVTYHSSAGASNGLSLLAPGQHAVAGSSGYFDGTRYTTYISRNNPYDPASLNQTRRISLLPGQQLAGDTSIFEVQVAANAQTTGTVTSLERRAPIAVPLDMAQSSVRALGPRSFGISDPAASGYPAVVPPVTPATDGPDGTYQPPLDLPLDQMDPVTGWNPQLDGTFGSFKTVLLQRLADPTIAFDPALNPYITIDRSSVDITAFNGVTNDSSDPSNPPANYENICFHSFQRGGSNNPSVNWYGPGGRDLNRTLWQMTAPRDPGYTAPSGNTEATPTPHYFPYDLYHTLGYCNSGYGQPVTTGTYTGAPTPASGQTAAFPWLTFNNRPFANPMELLQVPATNQYGLLANFTIKSATAPNEYATSGLSSNPPPAPTDVSFGHLLNFFQSSETTPAAAGPHLSRLLDFVRVPSPFVQADLYYNAQHFTTNFTNTDTNSYPGAYTFRPPFHKMSRFRDPGRVNVNTVFDDSTTTSPNVPTSPILQALFKGTPNMDPGMDAYTASRGTAFVNALRTSRQGYAGTAYALDSGGQFPSMFNNPFRAQDTSDFIHGPPITPANVPPVTAGFLRPQNPSTAAPPAWLPPPLFVQDPATITPGQEHEDPTRNPYFRYEPLRRAGNLFSAQSNCFAVWITIGYFEVEENRPTGGAIVFDAAHRDGYRLGAEIGIDSGEVVRHRGFYLVDRSIPVGFMPGSRLNTDDCILVRRLIE